MFLLRRVVMLVPLMFVISLLAFLLVRVAPGGPFDRERSPASVQVERALNARYHLDEPFLQQYARYAWGLLRFDFGPSLKYRSHTVNDIIAQGLPVSLVLGALAFCFSIGLGVPLGIYTALRRNRWDGNLANLAAVLTFCVPGLVLGPILIVVFGIWLGWFPVALWGSVEHTILPTVTLGAFFVGRVARLMREGMLNVLPSEFITAARARGISEFKLVAKHALRTAILPVVSYSGPMMADLLTGSFVVENIFQIPGIGVFLVNSSLSRDYPMVVGLVLLYAALLLILNLLVDLSYSALDPRVKYE